MHMEDAGPVCGECLDLKGAWPLLDLQQFLLAFRESRTMRDAVKVAREVAANFPNCLRPICSRDCNCDCFFGEVDDLHLSDFLSFCCLCLMKYRRSFF